MQRNELVKFSGVSKTFRRPGMLPSKPFLALDDVSFALHEGEFVGLIGHNGAGKSTSIKMIMGFLSPSQGQVSVRGAEPSAPGARSKLGYVPENSSFSDFLTGREILQAFGAIAGLSRADRSKRARELLESLDIAHAGDRLVRTYSKGMTQRLALAQALMGNPKVLILDEPMTGLDPVGRRMVLDVLAAELKVGVSMLFCSHLLADVEQLCERLLWLHHGKLQYDGAVRDLVIDRNIYELTYRGVSGLPGAESVARELWRMHIQPEGLQSVITQVTAAGGRIEKYEPASKALEDIFVERSKS